MIKNNHDTAALDLYRAATSGPWETAGYGLQFRVETDTDEVRLVFQYTASDSDWLFNFAFPPRPYRDQPVPWRAHWGFSTLWKSARDEIVPRILHLLADRSRLTITGYSQGAALAVLAHEDFVFRLGLSWDKVRSYAFAAPRVLWLPPAAVRERFAGLTVIRRRGDIVTMVPPWCFGFRHIGRVVKIGEPALPWWTNHTFDAYEQALEAEERGA